MLKFEFKDVFFDFFEDILTIFFLDSFLGFLELLLLDWDFKFLGALWFPSFLRDSNSWTLVRAFSTFGLLFSFIFD